LGLGKARALQLVSYKSNYQTLVKSLLLTTQVILNIYLFHISFWGFVRVGPLPFSNNNRPVGTNDKVTKVGWLNRHVVLREKARLLYEAPNHQLHPEGPYAGHLRENISNNGGSPVLEAVFCNTQHIGTISMKIAESLILTQ
jgi:hypothetical protein